MLTQISKKIACWSYNKTKRGDIDVTAYGIEILLDTISKIALLLIVSVLIGYFKEMIFVLLTFSSLRFFAGGFHMKTSVGCFLSMVFLFVFSIATNKLFHFYNIEISSDILTLLLLLLIGSVFLYAPSDTKNNPISDIYILQKKKISSIVLAVILSFIIYHLPNDIRLWVLVPFICEVVTILPIVNYKTTREEDSKWKKTQQNQN